MYPPAVLGLLALTYAAFLLTSGKQVASPSVTVTATFLGALLGFLVSLIFIDRDHRKD